MSISFGSTGIKPYVGSKEVKEAYVGSTLVYSAGPGSNYAFIGSADEYYLADWCTYTGATIEVVKGIYKITLNSNGIITLDISKLSGYSTLKFSGQADPNSPSVSLRIKIDSNSPISKRVYSAEEEISIAVNAGSQKITITNTAVVYSALLNNIRME